MSISSLKYPEHAVAFIACSVQPQQQMPCTPKYVDMFIDTKLSCKTHHNQHAAAYVAVDMRCIQKEEVAKPEIQMSLDLALSAPYKAIS